jgi:O-antigen/teichoic acid export membrane protein
MLRRITQNSFLQAINVGVPFVTIPWYVHKLGVGGYGKIGAALAIIQLFQLIVDYGFTLTAARSVAKSKYRLVTGSELFADLMVTKIGIFAVGVLSITAVAFVLSLSFEQISLICIGYAIVFGQAITPTWLYMGWHQSSKLMTLTVAPKIAMIPATFLFINNESDLLLGMALQAMPYLCTGIISILVAHKSGFFQFDQPNLQRIRREFKNGWSLFKSSVATSIITTFTPLLINVAAGPNALGLYLIAEKIRHGLQSIITPISSVVYPKISEELAASEMLAFYTIKKIGQYMLIGVSVIAMVIGIFSGEITMLVFGSSAINAAEPIRIMMMVTVMTFCNTILGTYIMIPLGYEAHYSKALIFSAIINVLIMWPLIFGYSYIGAVVAIAISEFSLLCFLGWQLLSNDINFCKCKIESSILYKIFYS